MHKQTSILSLLLRRSILLVCLALTPGCASLKGVVRDAHGTLWAVVTLTELDQGEKTEELYAIEDHILDSCQSLLASAHFAVLGEERPLLTTLEAVFSARQCRQTVDAARRELDTFHKY